ncbi:Kazal-like serine protease inhibitor [Phytophthora megakarya]|uniref:Kazal-like serine protease inhibitor n=1 Tax=Phytophthora megakarya TaxID=4795 RepID=A0A225UYU9_9STRA|nr:Kazal-like serine protease inhibitor [Phytophthora megakarya]
MCSVGHLLRSENVAKLLHRKLPSRIFFESPGFQDHNFLTRYITYVRSVTSALHQTEIILLRSYITSFVLSFYGNVLIFWLPDRQYFATMATMKNFASVHSTVLHLLLLASIEIFFLAMYLVLISHRFRVSGIHQLAFVLWSQRVLLQSKFLSSSIMILGFPLKHYGNDIIYNRRAP